MTAAASAFLPTPLAICVAYLVVVDAPTTTSSVRHVVSVFANVLTAAAWLWRTTANLEALPVVVNAILT